MESEVVSMIKSCIASRKGGVPLVEIDDEYKEMVGESIPFRELGFHSLGSLISSVPEIQVFRDKDQMFLSLQDKKTAHITSLVNRQKTKPKKKAPFKLSKKRSGMEMEADHHISSRLNSFAKRTRTNVLSANKTPRRYINNRGLNNFQARPAADHFDVSREANYRQAEMVGDVLTVTVKASNIMDIDHNISLLSISDDGTEEDFSDSISLSDSSFEDLEEFVEPLLFDYQLVGDDFLLHLAEKSLGAYTNRKHSLLYSSGLCISGQRIHECRRRIVEGHLVGDHVILLLGAVEIVEGMDIMELKDNLLDLLDVLLPRVVSLVILTIPPLVNLCHIQKRKWLTLKSYNRWLRHLSKGVRCQVVDIWPLFRCKGSKEMFSYYEYFPRKIVTSFAYIVLWNDKGRKRLIEFLQKELL